MRWQGEGILLDVRKYGETSALIDVFTLSLGRRIGLLRGAINKKNKATIQPGNQLFLTWNSRIEESLGVFKIELIKSRYHRISEERSRLEFFNLICVLCSTFLPERVDFDELYHKTILYIEGEFSAKEQLRKNTVQYQNHPSNMPTPSQQYAIIIPMKGHTSNHPMLIP